MPIKDLADRATAAGEVSALTETAPLSEQLNARYDWSSVALYLIIAALFINGLVVLSVRWRTPLVGMHAFRQTQTAITSYWLLKGSPWLAYETPVLGAPWSIPFECPLFQLLVAAFVRLTGIPLDSAGRLFSYMFMLLLIYPVRKLALAYGRENKEVLVFTILLLAAPVYLYWSTSFLIETFALFFSLAFLAEVDCVARTTNRAAIVASLVYGMAGALAKITTFTTCWCLAAVILLYRLRARLRSHPPQWRSIFTAAMIMIPPPAIFWIWNCFADAQKANNPVAATPAASMISTTVQAHLWNFGNWGEVFSKQMALALVDACNDTLGNATVLAAAAVLMILYHLEFDRETRALRNTALAAFCLPFLAFTNLYIHHNYYFTENAIFLIFAITVMIGRLYSVGRWPAASSLLLLTVVFQLLRFYGFFAKDITKPYYYELLPIAERIKSNTSPDSVVVIYGQEWSPIIPYYSERRALMQPEWVPLPAVIAGLHKVLTPVGGHPVEAIVRCQSPRDRQLEYTRMFTAFDASFRKQHIGGCDVYFTRAAARGRWKKAFLPHASWFDKETQSRSK